MHRNKTNTHHLPFISLDLTRWGSMAQQTSSPWLWVIFIDQKVLKLTHDRFNDAYVLFLRNRYEIVRIGQYITKITIKDSLHWKHVDIFIHYLSILVILMGFVFWGLLTWCPFPVIRSGLEHILSYCPGTALIPLDCLIKLTTPTCLFMYVCMYAYIHVHI